MPLGLGLCGTCCAGTPFGTVCGQVRGCNGLGVAGITVQLQTAGGVLVQSTTTDGVGNYCFSYAATATYQIKAFAPGSPAGYTDATAFAASYGAGPHTVNLTFGVAGTHICVPCCNYPIERALTLDGSITLTYASLAGGKHSWTGNHTYAGTTIFSNVNCNFTGNYTVTWILTCTVATLQWALAVRYALIGQCPTGTGGACDRSRFKVVDDTGGGVSVVGTLTSVESAPVACSASPLLLDFTLSNDIPVTCASAALFADNPQQGAHSVTF